jgi:hypothetical protein
MRVEASPAARSGAPSGPRRLPWWAELGQVMPRTVRAAQAAAAGGSGRPAIARNPLTFATLALDELAVATAYLRSGGGGEERTDRAAAEDVLAALTAAGAVRDPLRLYPAPARPERTRTTLRQRSGLAFEHVSFAADYQPLVRLPGRADPTWCVGDRTAHAFLLRHGDRPRPWLLVLHGHRMGEPRDLRLLGSQRLHRSLGIDIAHLVLPMHGPRSRGARHQFPGVDPLTNLVGFTQAVWDARRLLALLRERDGQPIGVYGVSLGGHVAALLAAVEPGLAAVIAGVPSVDIAAMLADTIQQRWGDHAVHAAGVTEPAFHALSRLVSPLALPVRVAPERRYIYAALADRVVLPAQAELLWTHWERPEILWLSGGHVVNNVAASRRFLAQALRGNGLVAN